VLPEVKIGGGGYPERWITGWVNDVR